MAEQPVTSDQVTSVAKAKLFLEACEDGSLSRTDAINITNDQEPATKTLGLQKATKNGHFNVIRYLLEVEPLIDIDKEVAMSAALGGLPIYRLVHSKYPHIINWGDFGTSGTALITAIRYGDMDLLHYILEHGGDPGRIPSAPYPRWAYKYSPIDVCAFRTIRWVGKDIERGSANTEAAKLLVKYGATLEATDALNLAVIEGDVDLARFFIDLGCDVNFVRDIDDPSGITGVSGGALHLAVMNGQIDMVQLLLARDASPLLKDINGVTALEDARRSQDSKVLGLLEKAAGSTI